MGNAELSAAVERILAELADLRALLTERAPMEDRSLPTSGAAQYLGIHPKTLSNLRRAGTVAGYRASAGGHWHYRVSELDRYRASLAKPSPAAHRAHAERAIDWGA